MERKTQSGADTDASPLVVVDDEGRPHTFVVVVEG